ncbi:MAG: major intrinsic protein [Candidatus Saccharibacteria bacterium]|nr:major intrinsic protein [Candidatus Saccharibacteria bacterium]
MFGRQKIAALVAEFLGTGVLTLVLLSVQRSQIGVPFFVASAAGLAVVLVTFAFAAVSGAHFNPALTIGMWTARKIGTIKAIGFIAFQLLGGYAAYLLYTYFVNNKLDSIGGHFTSRILVAEAVGAVILGFGYAAAVYQRFTVGAQAAVSGLSYLLAIVAASSASIGLINPAVAFGAQAWVWGTYVLGPILGAVIGINLYGLLFADREVVLAGDAISVASSSAAVPATTTSDAAVATRKPRATTARATRARTTTKSATATKTTTRRSTAKKPAANRRKK